MTTSLPHHLFKTMALATSILFLAAPAHTVQPAPIAANRYVNRLVPENIAAVVPIVNPDLAFAPAVTEPRAVVEQVRLADDYLAGRGVARDPKMAASLYEKAAGEGDPGAQFQIASFYQTGFGVEKNLERAAHWYQVAASNGSLPAKVNLAITYLWGMGVAKNQALAFDLISQAASQGSPLAACYLGDFYKFGIGTPQSRSKAEEWYRNGARLRNPIAEFELATMLTGDNSNSRDLRNAAKLLHQSAAAGYVPAMHALALLLVRVPSLARFPGDAVKLLNDAAAAGNWRSSLLLGVMARDGNGVPVDNEAAYYHFRVAALQGGDQAANLLAQDFALLSSKLDPGRVQAIDLRAGQWAGQHNTLLSFVARNASDRAGFSAYALTAPDSTSHASQIVISSSN